MALPTPTRISNFSKLCNAFETTSSVTPNTFADYNWPAQNRAVVVPLFLPFPYAVKRVFWKNGAGGASSNWDFAIYNSSFARLYSATSTASSGNSLMQYVTLTNALGLTPGQYYLALANDNATLTNRAFGVSTITTLEGRMGGLLQMAAAFPLPDPLVPAAWGSTGLPILGVCRTASGW